MFSRVFFKEKPARTLASMLKKDRRWYASMLCKEIDCTYPHMVNLLSGFEQAGLIETQAQGRVKFVKLTPLGEDLAHEFEGLLRKLDRVQVSEDTLVVVDEFSAGKKAKEAKSERTEVREETPVREKKRRAKRVKREPAREKETVIEVSADADDNEGEPRVEVPRGYQ